MAGLKNIREIERIRQYVKGAETEINKLGIIPRVAYRYPFDWVGLSTLSKAFALSKACFKLLSSALPDEAHGLSRSIVECATNLRYLTADPISQDRRTHDFVKFAEADKSYWYYQALQQFSGRKEEREIREYAKQQGIVADPKSARRHWSGLTSFVWDVTTLSHPLDDPSATPTYKKASYAADYYQTSAFVHCSLAAIDNYYIEENKPFRVSNSSGLHETTQSTLFILLAFLHSSIAYALFGMNVERPAKLNTLFQKTLKEMMSVRSARK